MILRVHLGLPGFPGTGRVIVAEDGAAEFHGSLSGIPGAWPVGVRAWSLNDSVLPAALYMFGTAWPKAFEAAGLVHLRGGDHFSKLIARCKKTFGNQSDLVAQAVNWKAAACGS